MHIVGTPRWSEILRYEHASAVARELIGDDHAELDIRVSPELCGECGQPIYLSNPDTADDVGDRWLSSTGRPICTPTIRRIA